MLNKIVSKPRKGHIEDIVDYYEQIEKLLQTPNLSNKVELIQVNTIEKTYTQWHKVTLVLYKSNPDDNEIEYEIFSRGSIQVEYRTTIEQLYAEGKKILDTILKEIDQDKLSGESFTEVLSNLNTDDIKAVEKLSVKINSLNDPDSFVETQSISLKEEKQKLKQQLEQIKTQSKISDIIHTYEHRDYLFKALREAKNRVMIVSPWIKANVVDNEFLKILEETLKRKVNIYVFYGIKGSSQQNDNWSIEKLTQLSNNYKNLEFKKVRNTHRKILVCDDKFGIGTSFNFLSFRADPNLTYRDELGIIVREKETIEKLFNSGIKLIEE